MYLPRQDHHPQEQHGQNDGPGERGLPTRADVVLGQPGQRLYRHARVLLVGDVVVAVAVDVAVAVQLDGRLDERRHPQDKQNKGPEQDASRYQQPSGREDEDDDDEEDGQTSGDDGEGE